VITDVSRHSATGRQSRRPPFAAALHLQSGNHRIMSEDHHHD
jgi:hypothetical protein